MADEVNMEINVREIRQARSLFIPHIFLCRGISFGLAPEGSTIEWLYYESLVNCTPFRRGGTVGQIVFLFAVVAYQLFAPTGASPTEALDQTCGVQKAIRH